MTTEFTPALIPNGRREIDGNVYMGDGRGGLQPIEGIKPQHLLEDETVRKILGFWLALSDQVSRFKEHTFDDISALEAILAQEYGRTVGGTKGNKTFMSVDGLVQIKVTVADRLTFGSELQQAKALFDECLLEWSSDANHELRGIVQDAFNTDKEGTVNRALIFVLLRRESDDKRWQEGQRAIRDAMRVIGTRTYVRCYRRERHDADWKAITIDLAKA